jgi:hypothetical protein
MKFTKRTYARALARAFRLEYIAFRGSIDIGDEESVAEWYKAAFFYEKIFQRRIRERGF